MTKYSIALSEGKSITSYNLIYIVIENYLTYVGKSKLLSSRYYKSGLSAFENISVCKNRDLLCRCLLRSQ